MTSRSEAERSVHIIVTKGDVGKDGRGKCSVTSHMSHLWEGTMNSQIHVSNSPYVARWIGLETFQNTAWFHTIFCIK